MAATKGWDLFHIDLEPAFLQGQSYDVNRDVVCRLQPEAGHPIAGSPATGRSVVGIIISLWMIFLQQVATKWNNAS